MHIDAVIICRAASIRLAQTPLQKADGRKGPAYLLMGVHSFYTRFEIKWGRQKGSSLHRHECVPRVSPYLHHVTGPSLAPTHVFDYTSTAVKNGRVTARTV